MYAKKTTLAAAVAVVAAAAIIIAALSYGMPPVPASTTSSSGQGSLSVLLTDPPNVPAGVTAVYVNYANLQAHVSDAGNSSGWTTIQSAGSIELLSTVNVSQTLSSANISSGTYNFLRFNITSAMVTYNGQNYTAFVPSAELKVPIVGGVKVNDSSASAAIIDISPTVLNIGSQSNVEFIIRPVAVAYPVPSSGVTTQVREHGYRMSLGGLSWWAQIEQRYTANLTISSASLTSTSLNVSVTNTGGGNTSLRLVTVSPLVSGFMAGEMHDRVPTGIGSSAVFVVLSNGSLVQIQGFMHAMEPDTGSVYGALFNATGFLLAPGDSATFSYNGTITFGFLGLFLGQSSGGPVSGQQYLVTVIGDQSLASFVVTVP
jgi:Domain of unknown function (DUF4382)